MNDVPVHSLQNGTLHEVLSSTSGTINPGMDDQMEVYGYKRSKVRHFLLWVSIVLSLGIVRLVLHWWPHWRLYVSHLHCSLAEADTVLVLENFQGKFKQYYVEAVETIRQDETGQSRGDEGLGKDHDVRNYEANEVESRAVSSSHQRDDKCPLMRVHLSNNTYRDVVGVRGIWVKKLFYVWDDEGHSFLKLSGLDQGFGADDYHSSSGLSVREQAIRRLVYGSNEIHVPMESIPGMVLMEILNPFYIFQAFSVILWLVDGYIYYPVAIVIMSTFGITLYVLQTRKSQKMLHDTVHAAGTVTACRGGDLYQDIPFANLVPGDMIVIPSNGCDMHCDVLLLNGQCIVNESMLTGESVPVSKIALPRYYQVNHTPHTLYCGTKVIQARGQTQEPIRGVVLRTGYLTAKGNLVRSILYPPPADFQFEKDSYKFIWILVVIAMMGLVYTVVAKVHRGIAVGELIVKALDLLTICIPPALPAAMTVGKLFAQKRLEKAQIYCINSRVINVSGALDCLCFDKTGTLTENGLDFCCGVPVSGNIFGSPEKTPLDPASCLSLTKAMAVSHSLTRIDGELSGDPLDTKMFAATGWIFEDSLAAEATLSNPNVQSVVYEPTNLTNVLDKVTNNSSEALQKIELYHQFTFDSTLQRMSVITKESKSTQYVLYSKGSPEMIKTLSKQETVPQDISLVLEEYTKKGFRVLALAKRILEETEYANVQKKNRAELETDLDFLGMIVMENKVKPETAPVITILRNANIRTMMITGDNMETAVSVARECGIINDDEKVITITTEKRENNTESQILYIPSVSTALMTSPDSSAKNFLHSNIDFGYRFAMTGATWKVLRESFPNLIPRIVTRGVVFARMSSEQKQQLILELKEIGYCVGMCGDGANDCGALRAADVGISLSDAEASVASPFTSKVDNISCVPLVVRQGRAALTTAFGIFKYMVLYSLMEFSSVIILYGIDSNMSDLQFLFIDIFLILQFAVTFGRTEAYSGDLVKEPPMTSLLSVIPITSVTLQVLMMTGIQLTAYYTIQLYPWFVPFEYDPENAEDLISYENYAVFASSMGQYLIMAFVYSKGTPYRQPLYTNYLLMIPLIIMTAIITYMAIYPAQWILDLVEYKLPDTFDFRLIIVALWVINLAASYFVEEIFIGYFMAKICLPKLQNGKKSPKTYLNVEFELSNDSDWPLIYTRQTT